LPFAVWRGLRFRRDRRRAIRASAEPVVDYKNFNRWSEQGDFDDEQLVRYRGRNVVERCFNKLQQWRGIVARSDKDRRQLPRQPLP